MIWYAESGCNKVGDEIQVTAVLKYYKTKYPADKIIYLDGNAFISAKKYYPKNLVDEFVLKQPEYDIQFIPMSSLWVWCSFLKTLNIYTEVNDKWSDSLRYDIVFCALLDVTYNKAREFNNEWCLEAFKKIKRQYPNSILLVDEKKKHLIDESVSGVKVSSDWEEAFEYVRESKIYIGGDTGLSHYAGAIGHKKMILLYGKDDGRLLDFNRAIADIMGKRTKEPEMKKHTYDSTPCCPKENFSLIYLTNNFIPINSLMWEIIEKR